MAQVGDLVRVNVPGRKVHGLFGEVVFLENMGVIDHVVTLDADPLKTPRYFCPDELEVVGHVEA
jgi:hypothetical protein